MGDPPTNEPYVLTRNHKSQLRVGITRMCEMQDFQLNFKHDFSAGTQ